MVAAFLLAGCTSCTFFRELLYKTHYIRTAPKKYRKYRIHSQISTGTGFASLYFCEKKYRMTLKSTGSAG